MIRVTEAGSGPEFRRLSLVFGQPGFPCDREPQTAARVEKRHIKLFQQ